MSSTVFFGPFPRILNPKRDPGNPIGRREPLRLADVFLPQIEPRHGARTQIGKFDGKRAAIAGRIHNTFLANCDGILLLYT